MTEQTEEPGRELAVVPAHKPPTREVAVIDTDSWVAVAKPIFELAHRVYDTEFVPKGLRGSEPATAAAMLYGREVGLPPMTALNVTHVIEGKPGLSAEAMRAMVYAAGHEIEFTESTGATCTIRGRRRGQERWTVVVWTIDMARAAGIAGKHIWKSYPRTQLQARCTTELCRMIFPDVIHGFRSIEELEDLSDDDGTEPAAGGQSTGTSKVSRKRAAAKKTAAAPRPLTAADAPAGMPPLPGEPGYDDPTEPAGEVESDDRGEATRGAEPDGAGSEGSASPASEPPGPAPDDADGSQDDGAPSLPDAGPGAETGEPGEEAGDVPTTEDPGSPDDRPVSPARRSAGQHRMILGQLGGLGVDTNDREERLLICSSIAGRSIESSTDLTRDEAKAIIDTLAKVEDREQLMRLLDTIDEAAAERARAESGDES